MERAVKRGLSRRQAEPVRHLGVDEKAFRKGHKYMTVVNDLVRGRVLYVAEDRKQESLDGFWGTLTEGQRTGIEAVAMDMWDPYVNSVREHVAEADRKIVFDKFHVAQHLGKAVDEVRRKENKALRAAGDDRLKGTRYDWLRNPATMDPDDRRAFAALRQSELKTCLLYTSMASSPQTSANTSMVSGIAAGFPRTASCFRIRRKSFVRTPSRPKRTGLRL